MDIPKIWLWTRELTWRQCVDIVCQAIDLWYTHIDTAQMYWNESEIWKAVKSSWKDRSKLFITTKIWQWNYTYDKVIACVEESLKKLDMDYIDLLLIHWPKKKTVHHEMFKGMLKLKQQNKVINIWVSNFPIDMLEDAIDFTWSQISVNQIEYHVYLWQDRLLAYCNERWVIVEAYSPLARGRIVNDLVLIEIAKKYGKTIWQIALRYLLQVKGVVILPKSARVEHLTGNLKLFDFVLDDVDIKKIDQLPKNIRILNPWFGPKWDL